MFAADWPSGSASHSPVSAENPSGSRARASSATRCRGVRGVVSHARPGRITSPQISGSTPLPKIT
ncbi:MAG: hypothetical protein ACLP70_02160 [Streptosporangiaceae bacterium]